MIQRIGKRLRNSRIIQMAAKGLRRIVPVAKDLSQQKNETPAAVCPPSPRPGGLPQLWLSRAIQILRGWSGKMAALTNYRPRLSYLQVFMRRRARSPKTEIFKSGDASQKPGVFSVEEETTEIFMERDTPQAPDVSSERIKAEVAEAEIVSDEEIRAEEVEAEKVEAEVVEAPPREPVRPVYPVYPVYPAYPVIQPRPTRKVRGHPIRNTVMFVLLLFLIIVTSLGGGYSYGYYLSEWSRLQGIASQHISQTTHIYDRNGVLLKDVYDPTGGGRRVPVSYKDIPRVMQDAMIAAEDPTFWGNPGIDPRGILRAVACGGCSGGSTITQQLIKNTTHADANSLINRKIPEAMIAINLTQQYPKWKILEMYFNATAFGSQDLGIEAAVEEYFHLMPQCDKNFKCTPGIMQLDYNQQTQQHDPLLGLARASLLAAIPQNPPAYDPTLGADHQQMAMERQAYVLNQMMANGISVDGLGPVTAEIEQEVFDLTAKMTFQRYTASQKDPHFVQWVIDQLEQILGPDELLNGGFNIRTTIDANMEDYVERAVERHIARPDLQVLPSVHYATLNKDNNVNDAAVVVMNAKTGEVLAMDGSTDYTSDDPRVAGQNNVAVLPRQPGSTFKPIVYATAFEMGWYPAMTLTDVKTYFPVPGYSDQPPTDTGNTYGGGDPTIRSALATSRNIPAIKALMFAGVDNVVDMARRLGITALDTAVANYNAANHTHLMVSQRFGASMALGTAEVPLIQMVGAYQVFANNGVRIPPQGILDVWDNYGNHLYHYTPPQGVQVLSPQVSFMMTSILADEPSRRPEFGQDHVLSFADQDPTCAVKRVCAHPVAAKTGTTDGFKDNLTIGYTPDVVVGVWAGNADDEAFTGNVVGITGAAPIWHSVIERAVGYCPVDQDGTRGIDCGTFDLGFRPQPFPPAPPGIHLATVSSATGLRGTGTQDWIFDGQDPMQPGVIGNNKT